MAKQVEVRMILLADESPDDALDAICHRIRAVLAGELGWDVDSLDIRDLDVPADCEQPWVQEGKP